MEFAVTRQAVTIQETAQDEFDERPIDTSFVLPDYCPDIAAVLKCAMKPAVLSRQISGDRLVADGQTAIQVMYLDETRRCVHCCEFSVPFTGSFTLKNPGMDGETQVSVKPDYVNCRATSPRRLDIHGTVTVHLVRGREEPREIVSSFSDNTVFCRTESLRWTVLAASAEKSITVSEVLELGENHRPAEALLRSEASAVVEECRVLSGKVIVKGELRTRYLYVTDAQQGTTDSVRHVIPFNQILDVPNATENCLWDVSLEPTVCETHITANQNGEGTLLSMNAKVQLFVKGYQTEECRAVTDAYSTVCPVKLEKQRMDARQLLTVSETVCSLRESLDLPAEGLSHIHDVWCEAVPSGVRTENDRTYIDGHATVCMLACDAEGSMGYFERTLDFTLDFDGVCDLTVPEFGPCETEFQMGNGGRLELQWRLAVKRRCYRLSSCLCVTGAQGDEAAAYAPQTAAVKIYYADQGERLWDIACRCRTGTDIICAENGLSGDTLSQDTMLLIPYGG